MQSNTVYIGLGSNLDDPSQQLREAIKSIGQIKATQLVKVSAFYQSPALIDTLNDQPQAPQADYLNAVIAIQTELEPLALLSELQAIENAQGRVRHAKRWQARTIDLDILVYGQAIIELPSLTVPHPELHKRAFVLQPLYDIAPELQIPGRGRLADLRQACDNQAIIKMS